MSISEDKQSLIIVTRLGVQKITELLLCNAMELKVQNVTVKQFRKHINEDWNSGINHNLVEKLAYLMSKAWDIVGEDDRETDLTGKDLLAFNLSRVRGVERLIQACCIFPLVPRGFKSDCHCHGLEQYSATTEGNIVKGDVDCH